jgi:Ca2+-transporting ATPase
MLFSTLALAQLGIALTTRSDRCAVWRMSPAGNPFLYTAVGSSAAGLLAAIYLPGLHDLFGTTPLSLSQLGLCLAVAALPAVLIEITKAVRRARPRTPNSGTTAGPMGSTDPVSSSAAWGA